MTGKVRTLSSAALLFVSAASHRTKSARRRAAHSVKNCGLWVDYVGIQQLLRYGRRVCCRRKTQSLRIPPPSDTDTDLISAYIAVSHCFSSSLCSFREQPTRIGPTHHAKRNNPAEGLQPSSQAFLPPRCFGQSTYPPKARKTSCPARRRQRTKRARRRETNAPRLGVKENPAIDFFEAPVLRNLRNLRKRGSRREPEERRGGAARQRKWKIK